MAREEDDIPLGPADLRRRRDEREELIAGIRKMQQRDKSAPLMDSRLPTVGVRNDVVTFATETVRRFNWDYSAIVAFAAEVCGVEANRLCLLDLVKYRLAHPKREGS